MTTTQIVIFAVLAIVYVAAEFFDDYNNRNNPNFNFFIRVIVFTMIFVTAVFGIIYNNQLRSEHPCPQLEKVEDVYKIK